MDYEKAQCLAILLTRKGFDDVKRRLRGTGAKYMMLYPATLKIIHCGATKMFDSPSQAMAFADTLR